MFIVIIIIDRALLIGEVDGSYELYYMYTYRERERDIYIYIYIYREREIHTYDIYIYIYIHIYIYIYTTKRDLVLRIPGGRRIRSEYVGC